MGACSHFLACEMLAVCSLERSDFNVRFCSHDCLLGVCAAHWAAIRAAVQAAGGLAGCTPVLHHLAVDLHAVNNWSGHVLPGDSLAAMFSSTIALLAPKLSQARRIAQVAFLMEQASSAARCRLMLKVDPASLLCSTLRQRGQSKWQHPAQEHWQWRWPRVLHCKGCSRRHAV